MKVALGYVIPMVFCGFAEAGDKDTYWLLSPTPRHLMRDMATDRPDKTESPYTVDAGHFQLEMDVLNYSYDRDNGLPGDTRIETVSIAPMNLKVGLCNRADLQLMLEPYTSIRTHVRSDRQVQNQRGFGDVTIRLKGNIQGNDEGPTGLAVMPYVKLPTNQDHVGNNSVEGGLIIPFTADLPGGWGVGIMTQFDANRDEVGRGHHAEFVNSITFGHHIARDMSAYVEFFSAVSTERGSEWVGTFDFGFTYGLTPDIQLDGGMNVGVTRSADDLNPFLGISWRF
jgi:hypothetical protein